METGDDVGPFGSWRCQTCGFVLNRMRLRASDGAVGIDTRVTREVCPNDGADMARKTWREDATDADRVAREQMARATMLENAAEMLWTVVAHVSHGDWSQQTQEWQDAARRWRDRYFSVLGGGRVR